MGSVTHLERRRLWAGRRPSDDYGHGDPLRRASQGPSDSANRGDCACAQRTRLLILLAAAFCLFSTTARADKLSLDEKVEIERGLNAEFATAKVTVPRSKKALVVNSDGTYDKDMWDKALLESGPASRLGDELQITRVQIESNRILFELNGGTKSGHWYDHVQVGMGGSTNPVSRNQNGQPINGAHLALVFPGSVPPTSSTEIKRMLSSVLDFEKHSATEQYVEKLPEPIKKAIKSQQAISGMDHDQVLLALGKPRSKSRETNQDGDEIEDWIYGEPPGKVTFVSFNGGKVVKVQESYANIGGTTAPPLPVSQ